ncbi:hypothetical protein [Corynebacterium pygosceleis]|uniref:Peptidase M48 domain-containing protein n=1 Tax=Corynebacterium pygosceleis TaxID=2800406 RepID=A0A9Q4C7F9_9CORY|nr:hypothetical protein [Corynebacterium pygosceleis]MCK7637328.1 hypothetical protein [Corynebacterium pygosceleis]MCK7675978.1 hypothetical protein [Corynebacterium pygosceleis]MCL0119896.1 hypothetical protein [Corynebacterium pygosceleis]MCX7445231.1 hypothetical protein [Corynebacterium pygosceleis]MCX7468344.1 hypothetical protein [Corynebacterium pygosceleis]
MPRASADASLRHRAELPLLTVGVLLTIVLIVAGVLLLFNDTAKPAEIIAVATAATGPLTLWLRTHHRHWLAIGDGILVTERQLPEIHAVYVDVAEHMGFGDGDGQRPRPPLYLVGRGTSMDGTAGRCHVSTGALTLHADFAEMVYTVDDLRTVRYLLAHQLGHILAGHTTPVRATVNAVMLGAQLNRPLATAEEYSADRAVGRYVPEAAEGVVALYSDKNIRARIDIDEYLADAGRIRDDIWLRIANLGSSHPVGVKRMLAFRAMREQGWDVHGELF